MNRMGYVDQILAEMAANHDDGASALADRGLDVLAAVGAGLADAGPSAPEEVVAVVRRLLAVRPAMAAIGMAAVRAVQEAETAAASGFEWDSALEHGVATTRRRLRAADAQIARHVVDWLGTGGVVGTWSWSTTALAALRAIRPERVVLAAGQGLGDGLRTARVLLSEGIEVTVVPDIMLPTAVAETRIVVVGADQVLRDGTVVNRCGTLALAVGARQCDVPMVVVCQTIKLAGHRDVALEVAPELVPDAPEGSQVLAPLFDETPSEFVSGIVTEDGVREPLDAGTEGAAAAHSLERWIETFGL